MLQIAPDTDVALAAFREEFPEMRGERPLIHLQSCSCGPTPLCVERALARFQEEKRRTGPDWEGWYQDYVLPARERFGRLYRVPPAQVAQMGSVSAALSAIAGCFPEAVRQKQFGGRHQVVVCREDFPTIGAVFQNYRPLGLEVVYVDQDTLDLAPYTSTALLVAISHVSYLTGQRRRLAPLVQQVHAAGAFLILDDSQSAGTYPVDFNALGIDFLVTAWSKFLLGGEGGGAGLLVAQALLEELHPLGAGWAAHRVFPRLCTPAADRVLEEEESLWDSAQFAYAAGAWRFAPGTASIKAALEASEAFQLVLETGPEHIQRQIARQINSLLSACYELNVPLMGSAPLPQGPLVALRAASAADALQLETELRKHRVLVSARGQAVRLAAHAFTEDRQIGVVWPLLLRYRHLLAR